MNISNIFRKIFRKDNILLLEEHNTPRKTRIDCRRIKEVPSQVDGLKKYWTIDIDGNVRYVYSEGIDLEKLRTSKKYRKKVKELLSIDILEQKEFEAAIYGMDEHGIYVGCVENKEKRSKKQISDNLQEIYTAIKKCEKVMYNNQENEGL